jgi:DNA ligase-1
VKFAEVAHSFDVIEAISSRLEITRLLAELLKKASPQEAAIIADLSLGQLHAPHVGTQFSMAEKNIIKVIAQLLDETEKQIAHELKKTGDLGLVVQQGSWRARESLTVEQVYKRLSHLEATEGTGSQEEKAEQLISLLKDVDALSAKYCVRIILGKLRLGFSDMTIVDALSWMHEGDKSLRTVIEHAYNICADIGFIAQTLKAKGVHALKEMHAQVGIPIRPAAAERLPTAKAIVEKLGNCVAQPKLDGFRLQIHVDKTHTKPMIKFFSRHLQDMSAMFPDLAHEVAKLNVKNCIAEGEAIGYDPNTGAFLKFQETVSRKRKHGIEEAANELPLQVFLFDILYLNGHSLLDKTHEQRRAELLKIVNHTKSSLIKVDDEKEMTTARELEIYFKEMIADGLEGLVVKRPDAIYQPGKRNFNWIKLKRQEEGHLEDTLDCVVLGYYHGSGKRSTFGIGAFLVGVYNKSRDCFETIARVGTGLKDDEWKELKKSCDKQAVKTMPKDVVCPKELVPDVWVDPTMVVMIRADEITQSPVHTAGKTEHELGYALRFPRFMGYRPDKGAQDATTIKEVKHLYDDQFKK